MSTSPPAFCTHLPTAATKAGWVAMAASGLELITRLGLSTTFMPGRISSHTPRAVKASSIWRSSSSGA